MAFAVGYVVFGYNLKRPGPRARDLYAPVRDDIERAIEECDMSVTVHGGDDYACWVGIELALLDEGEDRNVAEIKLLPNDADRRALEARLTALAEYEPKLEAFLRDLAPSVFLTWGS